MAGIFNVQKRKTFSMFSEEFHPYSVHYYSRYCELDKQLQEKLQKKEARESESDDELSKYSRLLSQPARIYFEKDQIVYSAFRSLLRNVEEQQFCDPQEKFLVLLLSGGHFAGGIFYRGEITQKKTFHHYVQRRSQGGVQSQYDRTHKQAKSRGAQLRRHGEKELKSDIESLLVSWKDEIQSVCKVLIRCPPSYKPFIRETLIEKKKLHTLFEDIPFAVNRPTLDELSRVWEKLMSVTLHGPVDVFIKALNAGLLKNFNETFEAEPDKIDFIGLTKQQRRNEKQRWPTIDPQKKSLVHEALLSNHYESLQDVVANNMELVEYLSVNHEKLGDQTFMHYAVKEKLDETVEFLLDVGCDPRLKDRAGKVPYEHCKTAEMKQLFVDFRANNPDSYMWTKCHIPEPIFLNEEQAVVQKKLINEKAAAVKCKRKEQKEKKKVYHD